jgi:hypothetical protein
VLNTLLSQNVFTVLAKPVIYTGCRLINIYVQNLPNPAISSFSADNPI